VQVPRFELRQIKPRLGLVALVLVAAGRSRARQLARSLRRVPSATCNGDADPGGGPPRRCAAAQEAAAKPGRPGDQQSPDDRRSLSVGPTSALLSAVFTGIPPRDFSHFGHVRRPATAGVSPPLKP
jgi:hypothetical protein